MSNLGLLSYSISSICYLGLAILLLISWRGRIVGGFLLAAVLVQIAWSGLLALYASASIFSAPTIFAFEVVKLFVWTIFMLKLLGIGPGKKIPSTIAYSFYFIIAISLVLALFAQDFLVTLHIEHHVYLMVFIVLLLAIIGLVLVEQIYRNVRPEKRWNIKFLCMGLGALFAFDLFLYSDALLFDQVDQMLWDARGIANVLSIPLLAISAKRNPNWSFDIFVSRHVVFYSTGIVAVGIYLILMSVAGYYLNIYGGTWGTFAQTIFLVGTILVLFVVMSSGKARSKLKVFLSKHFYKNKYDYREEWLRLIHNISEYRSDKYFKEHIIQTVAGILQCRGGMLFVDNGEEFQCTATWNCQMAERDVAYSSSLVSFLNKYEWVIDINEYKSDHERYKNLHVPEWVAESQSIWLILPLKHHYKLIGFLILLESGINKEINWEDRDLLKAVGRQISSYLAFIQASEALSQAEQFAAFNRLSAYVVHDMKNSVSQLELIVKNAEQHKDNPEFITDSFLTVSNVVTRMQKMLSQLQKMRFSESDAQTIDVEKMLLEVVERRGSQNPRPELKSEAQNLSIYVESDRFVNIMEHLVQNAQDATDNAGLVQVELSSEDGNAVIRVKDNGCGMSPEFIKERLFRPFDTTKGNAGMGIGAFEAREFVKSIGGSLTVTSELNKGTEFEIKLPMTNESI
jgi:putative PEP-CTERM system histidine kinase